MFFRFVLVIQRASKDTVVRCFTKISVTTEDMSWYRPGYKICFWYQESLITLSLIPKEVSATFVHHFIHIISHLTFQSLTLIGIKLVAMSGYQNEVFF